MVTVVYQIHVFYKQPSFKQHCFSLFNKQCRETIMWGKLIDALLSAVKFQMMENPARNFLTRSYR